MTKKDSLDAQKLKVGSSISLKEGLNKFGCKLFCSFKKDKVIFCSQKILWEDRIREY